MARGEETLFLSIITLGELRKGALTANPAKRRALLNWIEKVVKQDFEGRILPIDVSVIEIWSDMEAALAKAGRRSPAFDGLIAATAAAHHLTLVTRNVADFKWAGLRVLDPWR
jgi:predicted nucleic acid-binding protein